MRTLIIAVTLFVFSNCFSQDKEVFNLSVNCGSVYFLDKDVFWFSNDFKYDLDHQIPRYVVRNWSMNYFEFTASYFFSKCTEIGITLGRSAFNYPDEFIKGYQIRSTDTTKEIVKGFRAFTSDWWGLFYNFHYKDYLYAGIKLAFAQEDDLYGAICVGKKFDLENSFFVKTEISYSMLIYDYSEKITLSFGLGLNL